MWGWSYGTLGLLTRVDGDSLFSFVFIVSVILALLGLGSRDRPRFTSELQWRKCPRQATVLTAFRSFRTPPAPLCTLMSTSVSASPIFHLVNLHHKSLTTQNQEFQISSRSSYLQAFVKSQKIRRNQFDFDIWVCWIHLKIFLKFMSPEIPECSTFCGNNDLNRDEIRCKCRLCFQIAAV